MWKSQTLQIRRHFERFRCERKIANLANLQIQDGCQESILPYIHTEKDMVLYLDTVTR